MRKAEFIEAIRCVPKCSSALYGTSFRIWPSHLNLGGSRMKRSDAIPCDADHGFWDNPDMLIAPRNVDRGHPGAFSTGARVGHHRRQAKASCSTYGRPGDWSFGGALQDQSNSIEASFRAGDRFARLIAYPKERCGSGDPPMSRHSEH